MTFFPSFCPFFVILSAFITSFWTKWRISLRSFDSLHSLRMTFTCHSERNEVESKNLCTVRHVERSRNVSVLRSFDSLHSLRMTIGYTVIMDVFISSCWVKRSGIETSLFWDPSIRYTHSGWRSVRHSERSEESLFVKVLLTNIHYNTIMYYNTNY